MYNEQFKKFFITKIFITFIKIKKYKYDIF